MKRQLVAVFAFLALALAQGGGYFSLGYQSAGGIEFGGGGFGASGPFLFGGEGHGSPAGYGYGLGFLAYELARFEGEGIRGRLYARAALGGGGGAGWSGLLAEGGVWLRFAYEGFPAALYLAYQYAERHAGLLLRLDLGGP